MNEPIADREALWRRFLERWPLEKLASMTVDEYNRAGTDDYFCRWVERHTEALGSIWGGSSLKFGIYGRHPSASKNPAGQAGVSQDGTHGWYTKYGSTAADAFEKVRSLVVQVARAAREGRLEDIEQVDLWPIYKHKLAFLYQDPQHPCVVPIYWVPLLKKAHGAPAPATAAQIYRNLMARRGTESLLSYGDRLYAMAKAALDADTAQSEILKHFQVVPELSRRLSATGQASAFCQLASAVHDARLDWWITEAGAIHAGRSEDPKVSQAAVVLAIELAADGARAHLEGDEEADWVTLNTDTAASVAESVLADSRVAPVTHRPAFWPDDYGRSPERLLVRLTDGAIDNGYIRVPKGHTLFPTACIGEDEDSSPQTFQLSLPDGSAIDTYILANRGRIRARFNALFGKANLREGDHAVITRTGDRAYQLSFGRQSQAAMPPSTGPAVQSTEAPMPNEPLNQILYGPPGTGKTYGTIDQALAILDPDYLNQHRAERSALKTRFDVLVQERRVRFVTFHQSFSYEDFVEGLRATTSEDSGQIRYEVVDGVFKSLCDAAATKVSRPAELASEPERPIDLQGRRIWKMSLGNTLGSDAAIYDECIEKGYALLGWGSGVDFSGCTSRDDVLKRFETHGLAVQNPQTDYAVTSVVVFVTRMKPGDLLVISDGNFKFRAIGEIIGDYLYKPHAEYVDDFAQMRPVRWLRTYKPSLPHGELMNNQFSQMTLYELRPSSIDLEKLQQLLNGRHALPSPAGLRLGPVGGSGYTVTRITNDLVELTKPNGNHLPFSTSMLQILADGIKVGQISIDDIRNKQAVEKLPGKGLEPHLVKGYSNILAPLVEQMCGQPSSAPLASEVQMENDARVLIIDEINRGNVSRIFGELITLIEPSKRAGAPEALEVTLPYSKDRFSVPGNVYLIGTMNTADRSLAGLDVALRRRFVFKEMPPLPELLDDVKVEDRIPVGELLRVINRRIEALLDREHVLGHAYFMPLKAQPSLARLSGIFANQVLPLLQEYFFDDWQRIQWVLNDHRKPDPAFRFIQAQGMDLKALFGEEAGVSQHRSGWTVNVEAFDQVESYLGVLDHQQAR